MTQEAAGTEAARRAADGAAAIIFDNDGVLVDSEPVSLCAYRDAMGEQGVDLSDADDERYCGLTDADIVRDLERMHGRSLNLAQFEARKRELYLAHSETRGLPAFPGARQVLEVLRARGTPVALASSAPQEKIAHNLEAAGLVGLFEVVVSGEECERGKPDPEIFVEAARRLNMDPEKCVVVEDSINGLVAARAAGMFAVGVTNTFSRERLAPYADAVIAELGELVVMDEMDEMDTMDEMDKNFFRGDLRTAQTTD